MSRPWSHHPVRIIVRLTIWLLFQSTTDGCLDKMRRTKKNILHFIHVHDKHTVTHSFTIYIVLISQNEKTWIDKDITWLFTPTVTMRLIRFGERDVTRHFKKSLPFARCKRLIQKTWLIRITKMARLYTCWIWLLRHPIDLFFFTIQPLTKR